jgi:hypothetical protein
MANGIAVRSGVLCNKTGVGAGSFCLGWVSMLNETNEKGMSVVYEIQNEGCDGRVGGRDGV